MLAIASKVSYSQQKVLPAILNHHGERYNVQLDTVTFLKMRHDLEGFGYSISGIPITGMKALLFVAFVMLLGAVGRFFFLTWRKRNLFCIHTLKQKIHTQKIHD